MQNMNQEMSLMVLPLQQQNTQSQEQWSDEQGSAAHMLDGARGRQLPRSDQTCQRLLDMRPGA